MQLFKLFQIYRISFIKYIFGELDKNLTFLNIAKLDWESTITL